MSTVAWSAEGEAHFRELAQRLAQHWRDHAPYRLLVGLEGLPGDVLELTLNGRLLEPEELDAVEDLARIECHLVIPPSQGILGFPPRRRLDMDFDGLRLQVPVARLTRGDNQLRLRLKQRRPGADRPVRVSRIELSVGYGSG